MQTDSEQRKHHAQLRTPRPAASSLLSALINGRPLQDTAAGRVLSGQATNVKRRTESLTPHLAGQSGEESVEK